MVKFRRRYRDRHGFEAVPAVVVADQTDKRGKRLGLLAIGLLVLFFSANGYIQSAKNGKELHESRSERKQLISAIQQISVALNQQTELVRRLQAAVRNQNAALRKVGIDPIPVPGLDTPMSTPAPSAEPRQNGSKSTASPRPQPKPQPKPSPSKSPSPKPTPSPSTIQQTVCELTGIGCTVRSSLVYQK